ncbi:MAG TPA: hypothetical protein VLL07_05690 [Pontiella sp.]|nr:hypothetical protein [Pontiella sp.]
MYGYPNREKPDHLKKADEEFIKAVTANVSREEASDYYAAKGWEFGRKGDYDTAMKRFNQAWLLNPDSYKPYWGFGILLKQQANLPEAVTHFEKALSLMDKEEGTKPGLLIETAQTHMFLGVMTRTNSADKTESDGHFSRANELFSEAITLRPQHAQAYDRWANSLYWQGDYEKAWKMVEKARSLGHDFKPEFIDSLSRKMPEP